MNVQRYSKAGGAGIGAAIAAIAAYYLEWPAELQGAAAIIAASLVTVLFPKNAE